MLELPGDVRVALSHLSAYGLASILEAAGAGPVTIGWTDEVDARAVVDAQGMDPDAVALAVLEHARQHAHPESWTAATVEVASTLAGRLSPRIQTPADDATWLRLVSLRRETIDEQVTEHRWLDLALIGALGEPAHWRWDRQGKRRPDDGASRWEMKTRNRGEDFVAHRLHRLAREVAARDRVAVRQGLLGGRTRDEAGRDAVDSRTGTGLAGLGPVDNAIAWCALWGIGLLPLAPHVDRRSDTAGHGSMRSSAGERWEWFHLPVTNRQVTMARLGTLLASAHLARVAKGESGDLAVQSSRRWLLDHDVTAIVRFPVGTFGSASAPERRALAGTVVPIQA